MREPKGSAKAEHAKTRGVGRTAIALLIAGTILATLGGVYATSYVWNGAGTLTVPTPSTTTVSGVLPSNFPTAPSVTIDMVGDTYGTGPNVNYTTGAGPITVGTGTPATFCLIVSPKTGGTCAGSAFAIVVDFPWAATLTTGTDSFQLVIVWTGSGGTTTATDTLGVLVTGGTGTGGNLDLALEWTNGTPANVESITASVAGT